MADFATVALEGASGLKATHVPFKGAGEATMALLSGTIDITQGAERYRLREGDCLAMQLDRPAIFHNPTAKAARYAVVIATHATGR